MNARNLVHPPLLVCLLVACGDAGSRAPRTAPPSGTAAASPADDTTPGHIRLTRELRTDLTGDGNAERIVVLAVGPRFDSLTISLEIRAANDSVLHAARWHALDYFKYKYRSTFADSAARAHVVAQLDTLVSPAAVRPAIEQLAAGSDRERAMRETIAYDLEEHRGAFPMGPLQPAADSARVRRALALRADSLLVELRDRPSYRYFAGGEATYVIAWSPSEGRFVKVWACC